MKYLVEHALNASFTIGLGGTCTISVPEFDIAALDEMMSWEEGLMCRTVPEEFCSTFEDVL